jgi:hypothetical protein
MGSPDSYGDRPNAMMSVALVERRFGAKSTFYFARNPKFRYAPSGR